MAKTTDLEIRTIDEFGDTIDLVDSFPDTPAGRALAEVSMEDYFTEDDVVAVVLERRTCYGDKKRGIRDMEYVTLTSRGSYSALKEGGWI